MKFKITRYLLISPILLFITLGQLQAAKDISIYRWPQSELLDLKSKTVDTDFDGNTFKEFLIYNTDFQIKLPSLEGWNTLPKTLKTSLGLAYTTVPKLKLEFYLFKEDAFIPNLDDKTLYAYIEGLKVRYKESFTLLNEGNFSPKNSFFIAGVPYRLIEYRIDTPPKETLFVREYLLFLKKHFLIIRLRGPQVPFENSIPIINSALSHSY